MQWISVKKEKPHIYKTVLLRDEQDYMISGYLDDDGVFNQESLDCADDKCSAHWAAHDFKFEITHWMPMPESPKKPLTEEEKCPMQCGCDDR